MKKKSQKDTIKMVFHYISHYRLLIVFSLLFAIITVASTLYLPILTGQAVDRMVEAGKVNFDGLHEILIRMLVIIGVTGTAQWAMNAANNRITFLVVRDIRRDTFKKIQKLPLKYLDSHAAGDLVSRMIADVDQFTDGLLMGFTQAFTGVLTILGTLFFMLRIHIGITLVVVLVTPLSFFVAAFIAGKTHTTFRLQSETRGEQTAFTNEMIENQQVVQAY
ncbi:MAG: ABC transporter ATP-binding protein, partial [Peptococcaceae bacterium]|nr:ABC transporter ATP-binding protein [Peptococcaceae bacterium]